MTPLKPHWTQPSHPAIQEVIVNEAEFTSKSLSKVALAPYDVYARMEFPPCQIVPDASYATVQMAKDKHMIFNSDLLYINHSCEPSLIFDTGNLAILAGPNGLKPGDELTFFYPSTEWEMAQPFNCLCRTPSCRGIVAGARDMSQSQLEGFWLNHHIRTLLHQRDRRASERKILDARDTPRSMRIGATSRRLSGEMGGDTDTARASGTETGHAAMRRP